jgi:hypothetical protein
MIEMCKWYRTTGYPNFKPVCVMGHRASLKCHSINPSCPDYFPSEEGPKKNLEKGEDNGKQGNNNVPR